MKGVKKLQILKPGPLLPVKNPDVGLFEDIRQQRNGENCITRRFK
jgi:hypothetical protein